MSTFLYDKGRQAFLEADVDWTADDIRLCLVDTADYTPTQATDDYLDDVAAAGRVATAAASIQNKTSTAGVADGDDITLTSVSGDQFEGIVVFLHTGADATARLICYIDNYTGLPCTPNGGNITVSWPNDANKIFKL